VKDTDRFTVCCGASVIGRFGPTKVKPGPEADACEMVMLDEVVLVTTHGRIMLLPTCTFPKLMLVV
jgi:hypothetical protein